ncbi:hypothetical protein ACWKSP_00215 [Micromonosporaceae bacterium Da 78-11]
MDNDDVHSPPARTGRQAAPSVRRLASPIGLILAGLCLSLPFMSASCAGERVDDNLERVEWQVTYTGVDVVTGGRPEIAFTDDADREPMRTLDRAGVRQLIGTAPPRLPPQPLAWLAAALMVAALAATALPSRIWRTTFTAGIAVAAAVVLWGAVLLARQDATDAVAAKLLEFFSMPGSSPSVAQVRAWDSYGEIRDLFRYGYGVWITIVLLSTVGVANTVRVIRDPAFDRRAPEADPPPELPAGPPIGE